MSLGIGPQADFPLMYNKAVGSYNHSLGAFGARFNLKYIPQNTTFYPSLSVNATSIRLPLVKVADVVVNMQFLQLNANLAVNAYKQLGNNTLSYGLGVGISWMDGRAIELTGGTKDRTVFAPPPYITTWMPAVSGNVEYIFPISSEKPISAGIGGKIHYIYFFDNGIKYNSTILDSYQGAIPVKANLQGHMVNPGIYLVVYYTFGRAEIYY